MFEASEISDFYERLKNGLGLNGNLIRHIRDLTIMNISHGVMLVVACDSDGGIGSKEQDLVQVPGQILGRFAVRVPLMEMLAAGAIPAVVVDTLAVEMEPSGRAIIEGIREELYLAGLDADKVLTGSTEDNVPTVQTGIGVVVIGFVSNTDFRPGSSQNGDIVVCVGKPKSAPDDKVDLNDPEIADTVCARTLAELDFIHDILPVGSKGISYEQAELAECANLTILPESDPGIDIHKSAGPSTCVLASLPVSRLSDIRITVEQPVFAIGRLVDKD
ncbi:MAG: hypothetical protein H8E14_06755 [Candidatus Marinimicrobia bacterium]|nr:hypothetical protein [Candidatus Neomarinimicrobiota bacterium]